MQLLMRLIDEAPKEDGSDPAAKASPEDDQRSPLLRSLTAREMEVLRLLMKWQSNQEISRNLLIGVSTVKKHVRHILAK